MLGSVALIFIASVVPIIITIAGSFNLWNVAGLFYLGIGVILPLAVGALFLVRRLSPQLKIRIGSLSIDQFASVVASFATFFFFTATVTNFGVAYLLGLVGSLVLLTATVCAQWVPALASDFADRAEVPAHVAARDAVAAIKRPAAPKPAVATQNVSGAKPSARPPSSPRARRPFRERPRAHKPPQQPHPGMPRRAQQGTRRPARSSPPPRRLVPRALLLAVPPQVPLPKPWLMPHPQPRPLPRQQAARRQAVRPPHPQPPAQQLQPTPLPLLPRQRPTLVPKQRHRQPRRLRPPRSAAAAGPAAGSGAQAGAAVGGANTGAGQSTDAPATTLNPQVADRRPLPRPSRRASPQR